MKYTEETIYQQLRDTMEKLFELNASLVVSGARLYEDLDIDSIDAVNMIIEMKRITGVPIPAEKFKEAKTVADVVRITGTILNDHNSQG